MRAISISKVLGVLFLLFLAGCNNQPTFPIKRDGNNYSRKFQWEFDGHIFEATFTVPIESYGHYRSVVKNLRYEQYAKEDSTFPYLFSFAIALHKNVARYSYDDEKMVRYIVKFVQSLPYRSDPAGFCEYPKYPIETLLENGDCEDKSLLLSALMGTFFGSQKSVLVLLPEHMACGIMCTEHEGEYYYRYNNAKYYFCETTGVFPLGVLSVTKEEASLFKIRSLPEVPRFVPKPPERKRHRKRWRQATCDINRVMYTGSNSQSWFLSEELFNP